MAITSLVAVALQSWQVQLTPITWNELRNCGLQFWKLGKWLALVSLLSVAEGPISPWLLNWFHGRESAAQLQAVMNVLGLANPVVGSIPPVVIPATAAFLLLKENWKTRGNDRLQKYSEQFLLILAPVLIVPAFFGLPHVLMCVQ